MTSQTGQLGNGLQDLKFHNRVITTLANNEYTSVTAWIYLTDQSLLHTGPL
jgi:hypothetical protein